jgi:hypothetical protein
LLWRFGRAGRSRRKSVGRESDVRGFNVCRLLNLHELDLRFSNYAENVALLRTGFYDLPENDGGIVHKHIFINAKLKAGKRDQETR